MVTCVAPRQDPISCIEAAVWPGIMESMERTSLPDEGDEEDEGKSEGTAKKAWVLGPYVGTNCETVRVGGSRLRIARKRLAFPMTKSSDMMISCIFDPSCQWNARKFTSMSLDFDLNPFIRPCACCPVKWHHHQRRPCVPCSIVLSQAQLVS
jgi:hypothetical protein